MKHEWLAFLSAVQFLTRLPVPDPGWEDGRLDRAAKWFPMVGALVGLICGVTYLLADALLSSFFIPAIITVAVGLVVTGALHEDGLADFADGVGGGQTPERRLEIMKDSRIGSYGALALIVALMLTTVCVQVAGQYLKAEGVCALLIAAHALSRATLPLVTSAMPYARSGPPPLSQGIDLKTALTLAALTVAALIFCGLVLQSIMSNWNTRPGLFWVLAGTIPALVGAASIAWIANRRLGGWTGDVLGAAQVVGFNAFLLGATAWT